MHADAVVEERHDDSLEEIKVEDDGIDRYADELEPYDDVDALRQPPVFDE